MLDIVDTSPASSFSIALDQDNNIHRDRFRAYIIAGSKDAVWIVELFWG